MVEANSENASLASKSVIVRVPVGEDGKERPEQASMRMTGDLSIDAGYDALVHEFEQGREVQARDNVSASDEEDSSSAAWNDYRGGSWGHGGDRNYYNYQPTYSYNKNRWNYSYDYSYHSNWPQPNKGWGYNRRPCRDRGYNYYYYRQRH